MRARPGPGRRGWGGPGRCRVRSPRGEGAGGGGSERGKPPRDQRVRGGGGGSRAPFESAGPRWRLPRVRGGPASPPALRVRTPGAAGPGHVRGAAAAMLRLSRARALCARAGRAAGGGGGGRAGKDGGKSREVARPPRERAGCGMAAALGALGNGTGPGAGPGPAAPPAGERALGSGRGARPGERHWLRAAASSPRPGPAPPHLTSPRACPAAAPPPSLPPPPRALPSRRFPRGAPPAPPGPPGADAPRSPSGCPRRAAPARVSPGSRRCPGRGAPGCRPVFTRGAPGPLLGRGSRRLGLPCPAPLARRLPLLPAGSVCCVPRGDRALMVQGAGAPKELFNIPSLLSTEAMILPSHRKLVTYSCVFSCI